MSSSSLNHPHIHHCPGSCLAVSVYLSRICARKSGDGDDNSPHTHSHVQLCKNIVQTFLKTYFSPKVRQNVPRVSYISFLDIWMLMCMLFVFSCILEFIIATVFIKAGKKSKGEKVRKEFNNYYQNYFFQFEIICKILLPILFFTFNICYWPILMAGYYDGK